MDLRCDDPCIKEGRSWRPKFYRPPIIIPSCATWTWQTFIIRLLVIRRSPTEQQPSPSGQRRAGEGLLRTNVGIGTAAVMGDALCAPNSPPHFFLLLTPVGPASMWGSPVVPSSRRLHFPDSAAMRQAAEQTLDPLGNLSPVKTGKFD
jgi:hypothetical protein